MTNNQVIPIPPNQNSHASAWDKVRNDTAPGFSIVGHRGAMALAPENSVASFDLATDSGADEIELDVRLTGEGVPTVLHDPTLRRLAAAPGPLVDTPVEQLSLTQIHTVALSGGQRVLTFDEVLKLTDVLLQVEIKDPSAVPALAGLLRRTTEHRPCIKFSSFLPEALFLLSLHLPAIPRGLIVGTFPVARRHRQELDAMLITTGASTLYSGFENLTGDDVEELHAAGIDVHVWPLACAADVRRALELGADGGTADNPAQAREWLSAASTRPVGAGRENVLAHASHTPARSGER